MTEHDSGSAPMRRRLPVDGARIIAVTQFGAGPFGTPVRDPHAGGAPKVGEHTDAILADVLRYRPSTMERLRADGVIA